MLKDYKSTGFVGSTSDNRQRREGEKKEGDVIGRRQNNENFASERTIFREGRRKHTRGLKS